MSGTTVGQIKAPLAQPDRDATAFARSARRRIAHSAQGLKIMIKSALLATAFAVGLTSFAAAQAAPSRDTPPPPAAAGAMPGPGADARPAPGDMPPPPPPGEGPRDVDHRGPPPPPPMGKGIELRLGRDAGIRINCGDEPMEACIAAAKPLTDRIPDLAVPPAPPGPAAATMPSAN
ncbi:hypothetical protein [Aureimonas sp. AU4]|uniref:hypothetical protein n=1 Tax=Aureimonas sp. AU4 TaxID=1638163 RepID=UPI000B171953|nr:hypothetical protein [Aureimonas sp. AU4]